MNDWSTSLVADLAGVADDLRELHPQLGTRTHRVFLAWRRHGDDGLVREVELTPTPRVSTEGSRYGFAPLGLVPEGQVYVSEISLRYGAELLRGQSTCEPGARFVWELRPIANGPTISGTLSGDPVRDHDRVEYRVTLNLHAPRGEEVRQVGGVYA